MNPSAPYGRYSWSQWHALTGHVGFAKGEGPPPPPVLVPGKGTPFDQLTGAEE